MIIQITGTSGAGKTHLVRRFLDYCYDNNIAREPEHIDGRKLPLGYHLWDGRSKVCYLLGAYPDDLDSSGCDNIKDVVWLYDLVRERHEKGETVLFEGLFVMNHTRGPMLAADYGKKFCILHLTTPFALCVDSINARRTARGEDVLLTKKNTKTNDVRANNYCTKMAAAGARVVRVTREQAFPELLRRLGLE